ncbi:MAG: hypothetical protein QXO40_03375 [Candidatus Aenigmatarchaeota archaeon]
MDGVTQKEQIINREEIEKVKEYLRKTNSISEEKKTEVEMLINFIDELENKYNEVKNNISNVNFSKEELINYKVKYLDFIKGIFLFSKYKDLILNENGFTEKLINKFKEIINRDEFKALKDWEIKKFIKDYWFNLFNHFLIKLVINEIRKEAEEEINKALKLIDEGKNLEELGWKVSRNSDIYYKKIGYYRNIFINIKTKKYWEGDW